MAVYKPDVYLLPRRGRRGRAGAKEGPAQPIGSFRKAWATMREHANVQCRFHDLRHAVAAMMAKAGVAESAMIAILGWMRRAMLERYSHIRTQAKRDAVDVLSVQKRRDSQAISTQSMRLESRQLIQQSVKY